MKRIVRKSSSSLDRGIGKLGSRRKDIYADYSEENETEEVKEKLPNRRTFGYSKRYTVSRSNKVFHNENNS